MSIENALNSFGKYVVKQARTNLTKEGKKDTNKLYSSLKYNVSVGRNSFTFSLSMEKYGEFVDKGVRGAGGVRKTTSRFNRRNNRGKLWKIKGKDSPFKFGKSGGISPKHFEKWARKRGLSEYAVAKAVYHQGLETTNFLTKPFNAAFERLPDDLVEAYALEVEDFMKFSLK